MKELWMILQIIFTAVGMGIGFFIGECDELILALIFFVVVDYITGVMCGIVDKKLSSEIGFKGIFKKVLIFLLVGVANIVDVHIIKSGNAIRTAVIFFYLSNEGVSVIENATYLGLPVPDKLKVVLKQLHNKEREGGRNNEQ